MSSANVWKSEIRALTSLLYPPPPVPAADQSFPLNPAGLLDGENLMKRKIEADRSRTALRTEIHEPFIRTVWIDKRSFFSVSKKKKDLEKH